MAQTPGSSFIPKRSSGKVTPSHAGRRIYVFSYIAYILFFGTLLSVGGIFFLNQQAERQLNEHIALLDQERQNFRQSQLEEVRRFDARLRLAQGILDRHAAPSVIFDELEPVVVESVQFTQFNYTRDPGGGATLSLTGLTDSFDILLFQREVVKQSALLSAAEIIQVQFGGNRNVIEGTDRGPVETPAVSETSESQVTFSFEDAAILEQIGYQPRSTGGNAVESAPSQTAPQGSEDSSEAPQTQ